MADKARILVVDDDPDVREVVEDCLEGDGYDVAPVSTATEAMKTLDDGDIDLAIVDLGLPDQDGLSLTREIKSRSGIGIIILSGRSDTTERVIGLEVGADDYVTKPFDPRELLARVRSLLRRLEPRDGAGAPAAGGVADGTDLGAETYVFEGWSLNPATMKVVAPDGSEPRLSSSEFGLLQAFVEHPNRVLSRDQLLDMTRGNDMPAFDRSIDVQITRLRKKIELDPKNPAFIKTVRNRGYLFAAKVTKPARG